MAGADFLAGALVAAAFAAGLRWPLPSCAAFVAAFVAAFFAGRRDRALRGDAARLAAFLAGVADLVLADALLAVVVRTVLFCRGFRRPCNHLRPLG